MVEIVTVSQDSELPAGLAGSFLRTLQGPRVRARFG